MTALSHDILMNIEKPARYIGGEQGCVVKNTSEVSIRFAMCFPDVYEVGMSHLGLQVLYNLFNKRKDTWCERVFSPWPDLDRVMRDNNIPLFALESQDPVKGFDFLGITLQYEMCYANVLQILDLSGIPFYAEDRREDDPIVIGGGPCAYNPEPLADFFDMFYIGEGETGYGALLDLYKEKKNAGTDRAGFLRAASRLPGIYVPSLYRDEYDEEGRLTAFKPLYDDVPSTVRKEAVEDFDEVPYPLDPVVPFIKAVQDRIVLEVQRGCIRGCRFCQAGMIFRPMREKDPEKLKQYVLEMLKNTGYDEISLSSLSTSDYSGLQELVSWLFELSEKEHFTVSLPSLRIDSFALDTMKKIGDLHKSSLTFAPEAGSQRLRDVINKGLTEEEILEGAGKAFDLGWNKVKLYFMLGRPTETPEDVRAIPELADRIARRYYEIPKEKRNGKCQITVSTSFFVPKPFTPFQWEKVDMPEVFEDKAHRVLDALKEQLNQKSIRYQWHSAETTILEAVLARGDRRLSGVILAAYRKGALFDAWTDYFSYERWTSAFEESGLSLPFYLRERGMDELLPWDHISIGVSPSFLKKERERAYKEVVTKNCRDGCSGCGASCFKGGVCPANQD